MKLESAARRLLAAGVAPHAGAWIETFPGDALLILDEAVAPHAGAWIETWAHDAANHGALG